MIIPCQWEDAGSFSEGLAQVQDEYGDWGFIDKTGEEVISCQWGWAEDFSEGLARVWDEDGNSYKIDKSGKVIDYRIV